MRKQLVALSLFASLLTPVFGRADAFDPRRVPADAKWVIHADVDTARESKTFEAVWDRLMATGPAQAKFDQIEQFTGMNIPNDLQDLTVYGKEAGDEAGVILIHGKIDQGKTLQTLQFAKEYADNKFGSYDIYTWLDKDKNQTMFGAFHDAANLVIGRSQQNIEMALDTMDGKSPSLKADSALVAGAKPQLLVYVAADDLPNLHEKNAKPNPVLQSVQSAWISLSEKDDVVTVKAALQSSSPDAALDLKQTLDGLRGILGLAARNSEKPDPLAQAIFKASRSFATTQSAARIMIDWPIPIEQVQTIINAIADKAGAHKNL